MELFLHLNQNSFSSTWNTDSGWGSGVSMIVYKLSGDLVWPGGSKFCFTKVSCNDPGAILNGIPLVLLSITCRWTRSRTHMHKQAYACTRSHTHTQPCRGNHKVDLRWELICCASFCYSDTHARTFTCVHARAHTHPCSGNHEVDMQWKLISFASFSYSNSHHLKWFRHEMSTRDSRESAPETKQDLSDSWQLAKAFPPRCALTQQARLTSLSVQTMVRGGGRSDSLLHATAGSSGTNCHCAMIAPAQTVNSSLERNSGIFIRCRF